MKSIGFFGALTLLFITLKLFGVTPVADWSWLWVLSPMWGSFLAGITLIFVTAFVTASAAVLAEHRKKNKK